MSLSTSIFCNINNSTQHGIFKMSLILIKQVFLLCNLLNSLIFSTSCSYFASLILSHQSEVSVNFYELINCTTSNQVGRFDIITIRLFVRENQNALVVGLCICVQVDLSPLALPVCNKRQDASCTTILIMSWCMKRNQIVTRDSLHSHFGFRGAYVVCILYI